MSRRQRRMIRRACRKHGKIHPCGTCAFWSKSFSVLGERTVFWYNDELGSTHVVVEGTGNKTLRTRGTNETQGRSM